MLEASLALCLFSFCVAAVLARFFYLFRRNIAEGDPPKKRSEPCRTAVVLGSGGHTSEMMRVLEGLNLASYSPRLYIVAKEDNMSLQKLETFETANGTFGTDSVLVKTIPRARKVLQSYFTSIFTTIIAILSSFSLIMSFRPDLVLCNGPGTCIPICFWAYLLKFFCVKDTKIIYVESICRVQRLSLSGLILYHFHIADSIFVQWPRLKEVYPRTRYFGRVL